MACLVGGLHFWRWSLWFGIAHMKFTKLTVLSP
jgi:hypothetical protein